MVTEEQFLQLKGQVDSLLSSMLEWQTMVVEKIGELESRTTDSAIRKAARTEYQAESEYLDNLRRSCKEKLREIEQWRSTT